MEVIALTHPTRAQLPQAREFFSKELGDCKFEMGFVNSTVEFYREIANNAASLKFMKKVSKTILRLAVPKLNERGPLAFEQILASLHGLLSKEAKKTGHEEISFEIVRMQRKIYFYVVVPSHLRTMVTSQFYAQYPQVEIDIIPEYFTKKLIEGKKILAAELSPSQPWVLPFRRHPQFEDRISRAFEDPIGPITGALAHLHDKDDTAIIQFVVAPIAPKWNKAAEATLKKLFKSGIWQWEWFQNFYQWARLDYRRWVRIFRFPIWGTVLFLLGWMGSSRGLTSATQGSDNEEDDMDKEEQTSGKHDRETVFGACFDKITRLNFATNIRMVYIHSDPEELHAEAKIREIAGTFQQFSMPQMNHFQIADFGRGRDCPVFEDAIARRISGPMALSQEELATMYHLPTLTVKSTGIHWVTSVKLEPPSDLPDEKEKNITLIGTTNFHGQAQKYGIREDDRRRHVYIIGKTGMGKSTLLENMIFSDIEAGKGVAVIDPHGDLAEAVLRFVPKKRTNDVVLFDPSDKDFPIAFNMLEGKNAEHRGLIASGLIGVIKKLNIDSWGPRLEHFLRNTILALVEAPDTTMLGITRMLVDKVYRAKILHFVQDPMVRSFWETEFSALAPQKLAEAVGPIQNKVGQFLSTPVIRNIVGQPKSTLDLRFAMDTGKIVIVNLSKGKIGEDNSSLLGSLLITKFQLDAMSRADIPEKQRKDFYLYVDEFQNFATDSFATILSEARKYRLNLTMANQYVAQMSEEVQAAVFGNVGSLIAFQIGIDDAKIFSEQFDEERILPIDLASLPKYQVYNRIMVDGMTTPVFSGGTLPPPDYKTEETPEERRDKVMKFSRQRYAKPRDQVEEKIMRWARPEEEKRKTQKDAAENKDQKIKIKDQKKEEKTKTPEKKEEKN
ncbi:type IV secretion system DNA-binding domain-containing protein [Candidatus Gracilibacteria bacterium]|nr:type IV secretion system DNA-binding domain-containing protein [Candidatus Gracilibacteria bacterium]